MQSKSKFILSKSKVIEQYKKIKSLCEFVSYSSKTNPLISKVLEENTDSMFSLHMVNELKNIKDKSRVIFLAQAWNEELIQGLLEHKIKWFVVDNESDLNILIQFLNGNIYEIFGQINLLLRIKLKENTLRTEKYFVFGMNSETVNKKLRELRNNKNIDKLGIHFHRKTQNISEWDYTSEMKNILEKNVKIDLVCIGGGLPSEYANTNVDVIDIIFNKIKKFKELLGEIKLIIEPGRFIAASAVKLETEIIGIYEKNIIVDASVYNTDMDALIVPVKLLVEGELSKDDGDPYVIKGITPCSMDLFRYRVYLENPKIGNKLTFLNAGAYNFTTDFCDLEKIKTEIID